MIFRASFPWRRRPITNHKTSTPVSMPYPQENSKKAPRGFLESRKGKICSTKRVWTLRWVLSCELAVGAQSVISAQAQFLCHDCLTHSLASNTMVAHHVFTNFSLSLHGQCFSLLTPERHSLKRFQLQITLTQTIKRVSHLLNRKCPYVSVACSIK